MDSLRFALAIALMVAVIIGTNLLFPPAKQVSQRPGADTTRAVAATPATGQAAAPAATAPTTTAAPPPAGPPPEAVTMPPALTAAPVVTVESPLYRFGISTVGGSIVSAELLQYPSFTRKGPVQLVGGGVGPLIRFRLRQADGQVVDVSRLSFQPSTPGPVELRAGSGPQTLRLVHQDSARTIELAYTFDPDGYLIGASGTVRGAQGAVQQLLVDAGPTLAVNEADPREDYRALAYVYNSAQEGITSVALDKVDEQRIAEGPLLWVALKNKYFLLGLLEADQPKSLAFGGLIARKASRAHAADLTATLPVAGDQAWRFRIYLGPQETDRLSAIGNDFDDVNPYGWRFLRPVIGPLGHAVTWALVAIHRTLNLGYGWVLILFGVLARVVLWPFNAKAMRAQLRNMELQPRLKEVQERYKDQPEKMQQEVMRLYKEEGFNPLGGCLPMLVPMPVLFALYFVFQATIVFRGVSFSWLPDLSRPDPFYILPVLLGVSMLATQWLNMRTTPNPNAQMKLMTWGMPIMWTFFFLNFAAGLNLYYVTFNLASLPQQLQMIRERQRRQPARKT